MCQIGGIERVWTSAAMTEMDHIEKRNFERKKKKEKKSFERRREEKKIIGGYIYEKKYIKEWPIIWLKASPWLLVLFLLVLVGLGVKLGDFDSSSTHRLSIYQTRSEASRLEMERGSRH